MRKKHKKVHKNVDKLLSLIIITILLPLFIALIGQRIQLEELIYGENMEYAAEFTVDEEQETLEQELIGILAKEIGTDAGEQAILAQCVIARTNLLDARKRHTTEPESLSVEEMRILWDTHFEECYKKLEDCVQQTSGEVLLWEGEYAYAAYHAISAGSTRDIQELYSDANMPYLKSQESQLDAAAEGYVSVFYQNTAEFLVKCNALFPESGVAVCEDIVIESRDTAGYVLNMQIGKTLCDGEAFREAFALPSACFTITQMGENVRIVTKGLGHGFGLSQNTAEKMAEEGCDYKEILAYFFPGTTIEIV